MSVGSILALPIAPYIADIFGRRAGIITGCILMIIGVVLQSMGINIQMFIAARFLIGFGVAIAHGSAPLLIAELVHPQHRAIFTTIYNSTWYFGSIVAAWLTYGMFLTLQTSPIAYKSRYIHNPQCMVVENSIDRSSQPISHSVDYHLAGPGTAPFPHRHGPERISPPNPR
jgi:MFS family permease